MIRRRCYAILKPPRLTRLRKQRFLSSTKSGFEISLVSLVHVDPGHKSPDKDDAQDLGNIVLLDHVNLNIGASGNSNGTKALHFYQELLGLVRDPLRMGSAHVHWINI